MDQDEKLNEISEKLAVVISDFEWLREEWNNQHQWCQRNEARISKLETDMAMHKSKPSILMVIITILSTILAALLGWWASTK